VAVVEENTADSAILIRFIVIRVLGNFEQILGVHSINRLTLSWLVLGLQLDTKFASLGLCDPILDAAPDEYHILLQPIIYSE